MGLSESELSHYEVKNHATGEVTILDLRPNDDYRAVRTVPAKLSRTNPVQTSLGTWYYDGDVKVFDGNVFGLAKPDLSAVPHVDNINVLAADLVEAEIAGVTPNPIQETPAPSGNEPLVGLRKATAS